jgi:hypothetical protein
VIGPVRVGGRQINFPESILTAAPTVFNHERARLLGHFVQERPDEYSRIGWQKKGREDDAPLIAVSFGDTFS